MSIVMAVFTGGIIAVFRSTNATESTSVAQTQLHLAFQRLDQAVRYSYAITTPTSTSIGGSWYVELLELDSQGQPECRQLRLDARGVLQMLHWAPGSPPAPGTPGQTLASDIAAPTAPPFNLQPAGTRPYPSASAGGRFTPDSQRLRVSLAVTVGARKVASDSTFTAWNTRNQSTQTNPCREGRPVS
jgi:hypothetical protein